LATNQAELAKEYDEYLDTLDENGNEQTDLQTENDESNTGTESESNVDSEKKATEPIIKDKSKIKEILSQDNIKDKLDYLDSLKLDTNNLNSTLPFTPQAWNTFIEAIKLAVKAGNSMQKAVKLAIEELKKKGYKVEEINAITKTFGEKTGVDVGPISETKEKSEQKKTTFEKKQGKKSVLTRAVTGGANTKITEALEKHGLNYEVESQEEAKKRAEAFVKSVGTDEAIKALKSGVIQPGAELAFIYSSVIDALESSIENATGKNKKQLEDKYTELQEEIFVSFDAKAREFGRFLSALNNVYNSSHYKYN